MTPNLLKLLFEAPSRIRRKNPLRGCATPHDHGTVAYARHAGFGTGTRTRRLRHWHVSTIVDAIVEANPQYIPNFPVLFNY